MAYHPAPVICVLDERMVLNRSLIAVVVSTVFLAGCVKQPPPAAQTTVADDPTDVTSIDSAGAPTSPTGDSVKQTGYAAAGERSASSEPAWLDSGDELEAETASGEILRLNLALPEPEEGKEKVDHLFADSDKGPNYFKSGKENKESVKLKGKLYMIDEPAAEKRIENVDGGEVGIVVPLK